jgi:hypothetical protein
MTLPKVPPVSQFFDPSGTLDNTNCGPTSAVRLLRWNTGRVMWPNDFRQEYIPGDVAGGTSPIQNYNGLLKAGAEAHYDPDATAAQVQTILRTGAMVSLAGDYGTVPSRYRVPLLRPFNGDHSVNVDGDRESPQTGHQGYVVDPGGNPATGYDGLWWPWSVVTDYAYGYTGRSRLNVIWTPPAPVRPEQPRVIVNGTIFLYRLRGTAPLLFATSRERFEDRKFSADASRLHKARGFGGRYEYAKLVDGAYKGWWVRVPSHAVIYRRN